MILKIYLLGALISLVHSCAVLRPAYRNFLIERDEKRLRYVKKYAPEYSSPYIWYSVGALMAIVWPLQQLVALHSYLMGVIFLHDTNSKEWES